MDGMINFFGRGNRKQGEASQSTSGKFRRRRRAPLTKRWGRRVLVPWPAGPARWFLSFLFLAPASLRAGDVAKTSLFAQTVQIATAPIFMRAAKGATSFARHYAEACPSECSNILESKENGSSFYVNEKNSIILSKSINRFMSLHRGMA